MVGMLRKMREHVEKNFENVGEPLPRGGAPHSLR